MTHHEHMACHSARMVDTWRMIQNSRHSIEVSHELTHPPPKESNVLQFRTHPPTFEEWMRLVGHMINRNEVTPIVRACLFEARRTIESGEAEEESNEQS